MKKEKVIIIFILSCIILFCLFFTVSNKENILENFQTNNKYVCIYAYYEKNEKYKQNLTYFLNNGGLLEHVDYYFVINGDSSVIFPEKNNIKIIKRENIGFDFGAWSHVLNNHIDKLYDYYIFINSSVIGPYLNENNKNWLDKFMELFNKPDVKMVGSTINIFESIHLFDSNLSDIYNHGPPYTHIQTMFFILDNDAIKYLETKHVFDENKFNSITDIRKLITENEIALSQLILKNNWNINCIVPKYRDLDYRTLNHNINTSGSSDVVYPNSFFGRSLLPEEVVFYKSYRFE